MQRIVSFLPDPPFQLAHSVQAWTPFNKVQYFRVMHQAFLSA